MARWARSSSKARISWMQARRASSSWSAGRCGRCTRSAWIASASSILSAGMAPPKLVWAIETDELWSTPRFSRSFTNWRLSRGAAPALDHLARDVAQPQQLARVTRTTGRNEQRKGGRFHPVHPLSHQRQAVFVFVNLNRVGHDCPRLWMRPQLVAAGWSGNRSTTGQPIDTASAPIRRIWPPKR